jgi:uncharacterized protein YdbL (DUF1318 family)
MGSAWAPRLAVAVMVIGFALAARAAEDWKALRASGALGERYDGLLVAREPSAAEAAETVNAARRELYARRAGETNTTPDQVGRVYFKENLASLPPGTWLLFEDGTWKQK